MRDDLYKGMIPPTPEHPPRPANPLAYMRRYHPDVMIGHPKTNPSTKEVPAREKPRTQNR